MKPDEPIDLNAWAARKVADLSGKIGGGSEPPMSTDFVTRPEFEERTKRLEGVIDAGFQRVEDRFQQVDDRFQQVEVRFQRVDSELATIKGDVKTLQADVGTLKIDLAVVKTDIGWMKGQLTDITGRINTLLWTVIGAGVLTVLSSLFGDAIRHALTAAK